MSQVQEMCSLALRAPWKFVNCVAEAEEQTVNRVTQHVAIVSEHQQLDAVLSVLVAHYRQQQAKKQGAKVILFFTTARLTQFYAAIFGEDAVTKALPLTVWEIHSRKSQGARNKASDQFRSADSGLLFSSDVSARGVDYPNVSLVLQVRVLWG
jgi:ATP-dependent RNA helicase MSS116